MLGKNHFVPKSSNSLFETTYIQTLIIIDALGECKDEEPASAILSILSHYVDQIPFIKLFIFFFLQCQFIVLGQDKPILHITNCEKGGGVAFGGGNGVV